jgi:hypothetical protein
MPRKCKHEMTGGLTWSGNGWMHGGDDGRMCWKCGARGIESIGPSDEADERVAVEIDAASLAQSWADNNHKPGRDRFDWCPDRNAGGELCRLCDQRYLARVIATHGDE